MTGINGHPLPSWIGDLGGRAVRFYPQVGSTNDLAAAWAAAAAPAGAVVLTEEQTAGRGRRGRAWQAAPGSSLLLSMVLRPRLSPEHLPRAALLGAVALAEALAGLGLAPDIKWPNDVLLDGKKTAGILAEAVWSGHTLQAVVLGIGVNVYAHALPESALLPATTVESALGRPPERGPLLRDLLARLDDWRGRIGDPALIAAWRAGCGMLGRRVIVQTPDGQLTGTAADIDERGALLLHTVSGTRRLLAGDVSLKVE